MTAQLGEQLTGLERGDSVVLTIDDACYRGEVTDTERWMCELSQGFMESGDLNIYLRLSTDTVECHETPGGHLLVSATEKVPRHWDVPSASIYDPAGDEVTLRLGDVTDLKVTSRSVD